jgi:hypothetical protein
MEMKIGIHMDIIFFEDFHLIYTARVAFEMSQYGEVNADPFVPGMAWGKGKWPSWQLATYILLTSAIYGSQSVEQINPASLYGIAFQYADTILNKHSYTGNTNRQKRNANPITAYLEAISMGIDPLDFVLYVPVGYGSLENVKIPNVVETDDPEKIWSAHFAAGKEIW